MLIWPLGTNFSEMLIEIHTFSFEEMNMKMSSVERWPFCLDLDVFNACSNNHILWFYVEMITYPCFKLVMGFANLCYQKRPSIIAQLYINQDSSVAILKRQHNFILIDTDHVARPAFWHRITSRLAAARCLVSWCDWWGLSDSSN